MNETITSMKVSVTISCSLAILRPPKIILSGIRIRCQRWEQRQPMEAQQQQQPMCQSNHEPAGHCSATWAQCPAPSHLHKSPCIWIDGTDEHKCITVGQEQGKFGHTRKHKKLFVFSSDRGKVIMLCYIKSKFSCFHDWFVIICGLDVTSLQY